MKRRDFSKIAGMGALAMQSFPASASIKLLKSEPTQSAKIPIGLCNHSLRSMSLSAQKLVEYAIPQKLDSVLLNTFQPLDSLEPEYLSGLSQIAKKNDVSIFIGAGSISEKSKVFSAKYGNAEELLTKGIRVSSAVGSPIVGCRIGGIEDRYMDGGIAAHIEASIIWVEIATPV